MCEFLSLLSLTFSHYFRCCSIEWWTLIGWTGWEAWSWILWWIAIFFLRISVTARTWLYLEFCFNFTFPPNREEISPSFAPLFSTNTQSFLVNFPAYLGERWESESGCSLKEVADSSHPVWACACCIPRSADILLKLWITETPAYTCSIHAFQLSSKIITLWTLFVLTFNKFRAVFSKSIYNICKEIYML